MQGRESVTAPVSTGPNPQPGGSTVGPRGSHAGADGDASRARRLGCGELPCTSASHCCSSSGRSCCLCVWGGSHATSPPACPGPHPAPSRAVLPRQHRQHRAGIMAADLSSPRQSSHPCVHSAEHTVGPQSTLVSKYRLLLHSVCFCAVTEIVEISGPRFRGACCAQAMLPRMPCRASSP